MNVKPTAFLLIGILNLFVLTVNAQMITCTIKGKVVGRESKQILLLKATDDARIKTVLIPILEDSFNYKFTVPASEAYHLVFEEEHQRGAWRPIVFFPENGEINFTLHPATEFDKNKGSWRHLGKNIR